MTPPYMSNASFIYTPFNGLAISPNKRITNQPKLPGLGHLGPSLMGSRRANLDVGVFWVLQGIALALSRLLTQNKGWLYISRL